MTDEGIDDRPRANAELTSAGRRWRAGRWVALGLGIVAVLLALGAAGVAYATYDYAEEYDGRILPGSRVAGVDVGGLTQEQAVEAVRARIAPRLTRKIRITYRDRRWVVTPKRLGARSNARRVVRDALLASRNASFFDKMRMKVLGDRLSFDRSVTISYPRQGVRGFVEGLASSLLVKPRDASLDYSSGWVKIKPDRVGRKVEVAKARSALSSALRNRHSQISLPVKTLRPEVTTDAYDRVLLVRIGENRLYLYDNGRITHSWPVATGQPEYMTPTGLYEVTEKRYLPTWINPAPDTWGADMPAEIPPGTGNPLGLRAINWSAPAIRFHGTEATYSLGYNASHGCVRLSNEDVIQLYDLVDVGTPIVSVIAGELHPLYVSTLDPTPVSPNGNGGGGGNGGKNGGD